MNSGNFKLGLFVTGAFGLLLVLLLSLGVLDRLKPSVTLETYFSEPVEGLQRGAAVHYRGIQVGTVGKVAFASSEYAEAGARADRIFGQDIVVEMVIDQSALRRLRVVDVEQQVDEAVGHGFRARMTSSGLGGPTFIQLDYLDPERFPPPPLAWVPDDLYVPSAPSTIGSIIDGLDTIITQINTTDLVANLGKLASLGPQLERLADMLDDSGTLPTLGSSLEALQAASVKIQEVLDDPRLGTTLEALQTASAKVQEVLDDPRLGTLLDDTLVTLRDARGLVDELTAMADGLEQAATSVDDVVRTVEASNLIPELHSAAAELGPAGRDLAEMATRLDRLVTSNDAEIADMIHGLRRAALQLEALLEDAKANPSRMIFGDPPPKRTPGGGP